MTRTGRLLLVACLLAATAAALPTSAGATSTGLTLTGPATAPYYGSVLLTGTTPAPDQAVTVYLLRTVGTSHNTYHLTSDSSGHFHLAYRATVSWMYFATVGSARSAERGTRLATATCTVSTPAFRSVPRPSSQWSTDYVYFTATAGENWAGAAWSISGAAADVIECHPGESAPTVLDRFTYGSSGFKPNGTGSVHVVGITPSGIVAVDVQDAVDAEPVDVPHRPMAYYDGHKYQLRENSSWWSVDLIGVTADNRILGIAYAGTPDDETAYLVQWTSLTGLWTTLAKVPVSIYAADSRGDLAYQAADSDDVDIRLADGTTVDAIHDDGSPDVGAGSLMLLDTSAGEDLINTQAIATTQPAPFDLIAPLAYGPVFAADAAGDVVLDGSRLRTAAGALVAIPAQQGNVSGYWGNQALAGNGTLAYTATSDGLIHFLRCS